MAVLRWDHLVLCVFLLTGFSAEGACPSDNTPVIDLCGSRTFNGLVGAYIDAAGMADGHSSCSCSLTSVVAQDIFYVSMLLNQSRICQYYDYKILLTFENRADTWTCGGSPEGYGFTYERLDSKYPWVVTINKTQSGLMSAPAVDPGYCVILVAVDSQPINIVCGNGTTTTPAVDTSSLSTTPVTTATSPSSVPTTPSTTSTVTATSTLITSTPENSVSTGNDETTTESSATTQPDNTASTSPVTATTQNTETTTPISDTSSEANTRTSVDTTTPEAKTSFANTSSSLSSSSSSSSSVVTATTASQGFSSETSTGIIPGRFEESGNEDTGVGVIVGGILAALTLFFLVAVVCYFCNRRAKRKEDEHDRNSIATSTDNIAGYPYRQPGDGYVYYLDTSAVSNKDYIYLWSE